MELPLNNLQYNTLWTMPLSACSSPCNSISAGSGLLKRISTSSAYSAFLIASVRFNMLLPFF